MKFRAALLPTLIALIVSVLTVLTPGLRAPASAVDTASASGHVYDFDTLAPISGATVLLYADTDADQRPNGAAIATTTTDASGAWQLSAAPGENILRVVAADHGTGGTILAMTAEEPVVQDIYLRAGTPTSRVYGDVVDAETNDPVQDALVTVYADADEDGQPDGEPVTSTTTLGGTWEDSLAAGSYVATAEASGFETGTSDSFTVTIGVDALVSFALTPTGADTGTVGGIVADALRGTPLPGATVSFFHDADADGTPDGGAVATTSPDASGGWQLTVPSGSYVIGVVHPGYESWSSWPQWQPFKVLRGGSIGNVQAYLQPTPPATGHVTGQVTDADTSAGIEGAMIIVLEDADEDGFPDDANPVGFSLSIEGGTWNAYLPAGSYVASATAEGYEPGIHDTFTVAAGGEVIVDFALEPTVTQGTTIAGLVVDTTGAPVVGIQVCAWNATGFTEACADTDAAGRYAIPGLAAGTYRICYNDRLPLPGEFATYEMLRWYLGKGSRASATPVAVDGSVSTTTLTTVTLRKLASLSGTVGAPAQAGATDSEGSVEVYDEDGERVAVVPINPSTGAWSVGGLLPGEYRVKASGSRFGDGVEYPYIRQFWSRRYTFATATPITLAAGEVRSGIDIFLGRTLLATARPVVTGRRVVGATLRVSRGTWNRQVGTTFTYTWRRGTRVVGHSPTYRVVRADRGRALTVTVTATDPDGWLLSGSSAATTGIIRR